MKENEILFQISQIAGAATSLVGAVEQIRLLLEEALGARALTIALPQRFPLRTDLASRHAEEVLEAYTLPYRSLYSVPLRAGGQELGKLIACYASEEFHGALPQRVSQFTGEQLGMLLDRTRLCQDAMRLGGALARMREELATRKVLERAQGILTRRRGMGQAAAHLWIFQEARRSGVSVRAVAAQIIAAEIAEREATFRRWPRRLA